jgi:hypothetical protein
MATTTAIIHIKTTLKELATECLTLLGEGANPDFDNELYAFYYNNTPVQGGYIRIPCASHIATALQWMLDTAMTSDHAEIIKVEWLGQDMVQTGIDAEGNPVIEEQLFQVGMEDILDEQGAVVGARPVYLGRIY